MSACDPQRTLAVLVAYGSLLLTKGPRRDFTGAYDLVDELWR